MPGKQINNYRKLLRYPLLQLPRLVVILLLTIATSAVAALQPWPLKVLVDYALGGVSVPLFIKIIFEYLPWQLNSLAMVFSAGVAGIVLFAINSLIDLSFTMTLATMGRRMVYQLAADLYTRFQRLSPLFHSRRKVGDALSRLTEDTYCVYTLTSDLVVLPWQKLFTLGTIGVIAWNMNQVLTMVSLAVAPIMAGSSFFLAPRLKESSRLDRETQSRLMSFVLQTITAIPLVQAFGTEKRNRQNFQDIATDATSLAQRMELLKSFNSFLNGAITATGNAIVLFAGGQKVLSGSLSVGSLLVFLVYLQAMQEAIKSLMGIYSNLKINEARADRVLEVMASKDVVHESPNAIILPPIKDRQGRHVRFENVVFGYEAGQPVLDGITFEASPGETIALVGPTGSGKSTLASLALRLFDPWGGCITFDGLDIRTIAISNFRSQVAIVLQEPFLLPLTIAENIAYGRAGAIRAEVEQAAIAANADEFIRNLPNGYDTVVGERGETMSGGQKQRLTIARAFVKNAPVLILDEPTSALDAQSEAALQEALERLTVGRTTFIIAHRLSTTRDASRIVVLEKGKIREIGTHQELLEKNGTYKFYYRMQFPVQDDRVTTV
jgi:ATP-binding cassette subfamily B protein/subfamily B ATP-binding cassette protein MsbA